MAIHLNLKHAPPHPLIEREAVFPLQEEMAVHQPAGFGRSAAEVWAERSSEAVPIGAAPVLIP